MTIHARAVVVGGGIAGASIAYHLAQRGWRDIYVLDQGPLIGGTTAHAPGLVGQLRASESLTRMLMYSVALYRTLKVDGAPGFHEVGSLRLASSPARMRELRRQHAFAQSVGLDAQLLSPAEAMRRFPLMSADKLEGALHLPFDGSATATVLAEALVHQAQVNGVRFHAHEPLRAVEIVNQRVCAAITTNDRYETGTLVVAAGIWSTRVGRLAEVALPLIPMRHQYVVTEELSALVGMTLPNLRDPDQRVYFRQRGQALLLGGYETNPQTVCVDAIPDRTNPTILPFDSTQFDSLRQSARERMPALSTANEVEQVNGLEAFTADGEFLLGPSRFVRGFWAACGFCAHGISSAGGVGKVLADWIVDGGSDYNLDHLAPERHAALSENELQARACHVYRTYYDLSPDVTTRVG